MKRSMVLMVLFVLGALVATSSAAFDNQQENSVIATDSQAQVKDMKCGEKGCGEEKKQCDKAAKCEKKKECPKAQKGDCPASGCCEKCEGCDKKAECSEAQKAECEKKKQCCQKGDACSKKK